ncbi:hypothetical protein [Kineosporia babensis]|uniref:Uncharacterized protein n=1 Tax=Kineosporia babensis TaxID=499548 RepID=A0A9X1ST33_9ACTN|nr:hypothetical protein [Kineosporia babensis]MCD5310871.1 hypothetical protein [Kineosporia babensis]
MSVPPEEFDGGAEEDGPQTAEAMALIVRSHLRQYDCTEVDADGSSGDWTFNVAIGAKVFAITVSGVRT